MPEDAAPHEGQILRSSLFSEPMRVETVQAGGDGTWVLGLVGVSSERFRKVTLSAVDPVLQEPLKDPARLAWHEVKKVAHYYLSVDALAKLMKVHENEEPYGGGHP